MKKERGNALLLILIAVALFAALSYAITQSGRGGGTIGAEQALITSGQVTQYPAHLRMIVTAQMLAGGVAAAAISTSANMAIAPCSVTPANCLFSPSGGSGIVEDAPTAAFASTVNPWVFNDLTTTSLMYVKGVGTDVTTIGAEATASLAGISLMVCQQIQKGLGFASPYTPVATLATVNWSTPGTGGYVSGGSAATVAMTGGADGFTFQCVNNGGSYDYYHVLIEQ